MVEPPHVRPQQCGLTPHCYAGDIQICLCAPAADAGVAAQRVTNCIAEIPVLRELHWLPVRERIQYAKWGGGTVIRILDSNATEWS